MHGDGTIGDGRKLGDALGLLVRDYEGGEVGASDGIPVASDVGLGDEPLGDG